MRWAGLGGLVVTLLISTGCAAKIDRFTIDRVVQRGMQAPDLEKVCALGEGLGHVLAAGSSEKNPAHKALVIAEATAGICFQLEAFEAELTGARAKQNLRALGAKERAAELRDALILEQRAHGRAAERFYRSWNHLEALYGPLGDSCPTVHQRDEVVYLVGLVSGTLALLHDKASGNRVGIPLDLLPRISRSAPCLADEDWWSVPSSLEAASWAIIPGSGPDGVDPWERLEQAAVAGETSGVRVARALGVMVAANAGETEVISNGIAAHASSNDSHSQDPAWALLDEYAAVISLHQSDLVWTEARGYRTPSFGELPVDESLPAPSEGDDPFGSDPFGEDPFGGGEAEAEPDNEEEPDSDVEQTHDDNESH